MCLGASSAFSLVASRAPLLLLARSFAAVGLLVAAARARAPVVARLVVSFNLFGGGLFALSLIFALVAILLNRALRSRCAFRAPARACRPRASPPPVARCRSLRGLPARSLCSLSLRSAVRFSGAGARALLPRCAWSRCARSPPPRPFFSAGALSWVVRRGLPSQALAALALRASVQLPSRLRLGVPPLLSVLGRLRLHRFL